MSVQQRVDGRWQGWVGPNTRLDSFELREHAEIEYMVYSEWWQANKDPLTEEHIRLRDRSIIWEEIVAIMKIMGRKV